MAENAQIETSGGYWLVTTKRKTGGDPPNFNRKTFTNDLGHPQVVLLPEGETDVKAGIPVSLDLSGLYAHMPESFLKALYDNLHAQGLIEAKDFFKPGASDRFRAAMLSVIRHDFLSVQTIANEELQNG